MNRGSSSSMVLAASFIAVSAPADTNEDTLATINVPALGANDGLRIATFWTVTNNANVKTARVRFSGASGTQYGGGALTSRVSGIEQIWIQNRNATNSQAGGKIGFDSAGSSFGSVGSITTSAVDTTAPTTIVITAQKASGGDTMTLEGFIVEIIRP